MWGTFGSLSISVCSDYVDQRAARAYFGMVFIWWYVNYFSKESGLPSTGWELKQDIDALYAHFAKHAKKSDFKAWMENAMEGSRLEKVRQRDRQQEHLS
jgi:hypothetical protein